MLFSDKDRSFTITSSLQFLSLFSPDMERSIPLAASAHHTLGDGKTDSTKPINPVFAFVLFLDKVS
jgi:hypothetical protein